MALVPKTPATKKDMRQRKPAGKAGKGKTSQKEKVMNGKKIEKFPVDVMHPYVAKRSQAAIQAEAREGMRRLLGPDIIPFDPLGAGYDIKAAREAGMKRDETGRMASRSPSGQILKGMYHPTFRETIAGEKAAGYEIYKGDDGKLYSRKVIK